MDERQALSAFSALSQETRLRVLRRLVIAGKTGIAAGAIAESVGISPSNLSFHIKELEHSGLVGARREGRSVIYVAEYDAISDLVRFLLEDCCAGHPEICMPAMKTAACCVGAETVE